MRHAVVWLVGVALIVGASQVFAHEEHAHEQEASAPSVPEEDTLTGEVVDVLCYLSHGEDGLGKGHAACAKKCIKNGLPVAIKVGDQLYLASMSDHNPANATLADFAAKRVTVTGTIMERDGQQLIAISHVEEAD